MFRFNFDIDDAEDDGFGPVVAPDPAPAQTERDQPENTVAEHSSREVPLDELVRFPVLAHRRFYTLLMLTAP